MKRAWSMFLNGGYWPSWLYYEGVSPSSVSAVAITHVHYAFANVDGDGTVYLADECVHYEADIDGTNGGLRAWTQRKQSYPSLKVTLAIGGGLDGVAARFADVVADEQKLAAFVKSVKHLVDQFTLDGIDIDWEYPSEQRHARGHLHLLQSLRTVLGPSVWITTALPVDTLLLSKMHLTQLSNVVDFVNLMAYDISVQSNFAQAKMKRHNTKLFSPAHKQKATGKQDNGAAAVDYLLAQGIASHKIMLGVPCYGYPFDDASLPNHPFHHPECGEQTITKPGHEAKGLPPWPVKRGISNFKVVAAYNPDKRVFATYDNKDEVLHKAEYVKQKGLRGLFYWHLAGDRVSDASLIQAGYRALHADE